MEQLQCKMCGGNELIKENKLYTCQHCGCKYTIDMCDIVGFSNKDNDELDVETLICSIKGEWSNIPLFNQETDNKIYAEVKRIGHLDKEVIDLELVDVFKDGYGINGCGYETAVYNITGDRIKYFTVLSVAHNHVEDKVGVNVTRFTGPIEVGEYKEYWVDGIWNDNTIGLAKIDSILFEFFDGKKVIYSCDDLNIEPADLDIVRLTKTNKIKRCNADARNKIFVSARVCHEEVDFDSLINDFDAKKYISGSGSGDFGVLFDIENISSKSINSIEVYFQGFNPVKDKVDNVKEFTIYGPMPVTFVGYAFWELWDQDACVISSVDILGATVNFTDGTVEFYKKDDLAKSGRTNSKYQSSSHSEPQTFTEAFKQGFEESYSKSGGCYVATAVYGSYNCPEVWTLRRYRDYTLAETWYGRAFIKIYYAISPTLVKWFGHTEWFKNMWKGKLDSMVAKLQANGVESTPYEDKNW